MVASGGRSAACSRFATMVAVSMWMYQPGMVPPEGCWSEIGLDEVERAEVDVVGTDVLLQVVEEGRRGGRRPVDDDCEHQGIAGGRRSSCEGVRGDDPGSPAQSGAADLVEGCLLYTSPSPRDGLLS